MRLIKQKMFLLSVCTGKEILNENVLYKFNGRDKFHPPFSMLGLIY